MCADGVVCSSRSLDLDELKAWLDVTFVKGLFKFELFKNSIPNCHAYIDTETFHFHPILMKNVLIRPEISMPSKTSVGFLPELPSSNPLWNYLL
jgi:hypothetical protein